MAKTLAMRRHELGLSKPRIAELVGTSYVTYVNWEKGRSFPDARHHAKLAEVFRVPFDELLPALKPPTGPRNRLPLSEEERRQRGESIRRGLQERREFEQERRIA